MDGHPGDAAAADGAREAAAAAGGAAQVRPWRRCHHLIELFTLPCRPMMLSLCSSKWPQQSPQHFWCFVSRLTIEVFSLWRGTIEVATC